MTGKRLLIVEDDISFARTLSRSFERRGYQVQVAHGQEEVAELIKAALTGTEN